jgi:hypothetical protein
MRLKNRYRHALSTAARPVIETMEDRRMLSGTLTILNPDGLPSSSRLIFNTIDVLNTSTPNAYHNTSPLLLENTGTTPLTINSITPSGPFALVNGPADGTVIAAGSSLTITVQFTQTSLPAHSLNETNYTTNPNGGAAIGGSLAISTSDLVTPTQTVALAGYWQSQSEDNAEPNLTTIVNTLAGYQTVISNTYQVDLTEPSDAVMLYGSEVASASWQAADPSQGVNIQQLAEFHTEGNTVHSYWYDSASQTSHLLFTSLSDEGQTLLPHTEGGALATSTFYPNSTPFGLRVDNEYSDDAINAANGNSGGGGHHFRFYPLVDSNGNTVPNTYLVAMDYAVLQTENYDFQDNVFIVSNIRPATAPPAPASLTATSGVQPVLNWTAVSYTPLAGYNVYRATSATGPYAKLTSAPITATTFTDTGAPVGETVYYEVTSVDSSSGQESSAASATANTPPGPTAVADTASAYTSQPTVIPVLANDTDAGGSITPASVTILSAPNHGGTAVVDTTTGSVTYTSAAGYSGSETFTYDETDSNGNVSAPGTVVVTVTNPVTFAPTANGDQALTLVGTSVPIGVLANDTAVTTLDPTTVTPTSPGHGTTSVAADGTITYTPAANYVGSDSFTYTVRDDNGQISNAATVSVYVGVPVSTAKGSYRTLKYTDTGGTPVTLTLNRGVADVYFSGTGSAASVLKGLTTTVSGSRMFIQQLTLTGTTAASTLSISARSTGNVALGGVTDTGTLGNFNAVTTNLSGTAEFGGLNNLNLRSVVETSNGANVITVGNGNKSLAVNITNASDTSLTSAVAIRSLKTNSWTNTANGTLAVTAPSLSSLAVKGAFSPSLILTGTGTSAATLGTASITGSLGTGYWDISGSTHAVSVGAVGKAWGATFNGAVGSLVIRSGGLPNDVTAQAVTSLSVTGDLTGDLTALSVRSLKVNGNVTGTTLDFAAGISRTPALGSLVVTGAVTNSSVLTNGNASLIQAASFSGSLIEIGSSSATTVATAATGNIGGATLGTFRTTAKTGTVFSDTNVIAYQVNSLSVGQVNATSGTEGVAAHVLKSVVVGIDNGRIALHSKALVSNAAVTTALSGKTLGTFVVDVV